MSMHAARNFKAVIEK